MKKSDAIKQIKLLLQSGWTKGAFAKNKVGENVCALDPGAVCYCLLGALKKIVLPVSTSLFDSLYKDFCDAGEFTEMTQWNDAEERKLEDLMDACDWVLKYAEKEEAGENP